MRIIKFCAVLSLSFAYSDVIDHLKEIDDKTYGHSFKNIDFIYLINLDQRPEKYEQSISQLHPYGIYPYRFSAVNGWELSLEEINDVGVKFSPGMCGNFRATSYLYNLERHDENVQKFYHLFPLDDL